MKLTSDHVTATVLAQLDHLAAHVSRDAADEISLAMIRGCVRSLRGRKPQLTRLIEVIVDEALSRPANQMQ